MMFPITGRLKPKDRSFQILAKNQTAIFRMNDI